MQSWIPTAHAMKGRKAEVKAKVQIVCKDTNNERSNCVQSYKCRGACKGNAISLSKSPVSATTVVCFFNSSSWLMLTFLSYSRKMRIQMSAVGLTTLLARNLLSRAPRRLANAASIASPAGIQTSCASGILFGDSELQQSWRPCLQPQRRLFATTSSSQKPGSRDGESRVYGQRYHAEVGEKYSSVRQKHHRKHRGAEYHKGRPNRGRKAMRLGEEQGHKYKTGRHGEPLVLLNDKWVGSDYFNERLANAAKRNNVAEAEAVYDEMVEICRLQPDVGTYNHLISVHGRRGNATRAFKYYQQIKKRALEANGYTYTSLFNACATGLLPDHELAMKLFDELAKKEIAMHTYHFNALLKVCAKIGDDEGQCSPGAAEQHSTLL